MEEHLEEILSDLYSEGIHNIDGKRGKDWSIRVALQAIKAKLKEQDRLAKESLLIQLLASLESAEVPYDDEGEFDHIYFVSESTLQKRLNELRGLL